MTHGRLADLDTQNAEGRCALNYALVLGGRSDQGIAVVRQTHWSARTVDLQRREDHLHPANGAREMTPIPTLTSRHAFAVLGLTLLAACAPTTRRQVVNPPGISPLVPAYSVAIRDGAMVFVSGMTGIKPGTQDIVDGGVAIQTRQALENVRTALQSAGATMADVGECTVFLVDMAEYAAMNAAYVQYFPAEQPARATVAVSALPRPTARVEIKCSAVTGAR